MLDIIFISYDEPNAEENFRRLKRRFPHTKRVIGVKGIANAHFEAAKRASTSFFYVVDGDAEVHDSFDFSYKPTRFESEYVHIWHAFNPALNQDYGFGGVKLFHKSFFKNISSYVDFTTTLTRDVKIMPEVACTTRFNSDPYRAYRAAFRESFKLYKTSIDRSSLLRPTRVQREATKRLEIWLNPVECDFRKYVSFGAQDGVSYAQSDGDGLRINDYDMIKSHFDQRFPEAMNQVVVDDRPVKQEFFFTTRIASVLYDQYVLSKLPLTELRDALSDGQMYSKLWLVEQFQELINRELIARDTNVVILGGWIGTLSLLMNSFKLPVRITSVDLDERSNRISEKLNYGFDFKTLTADMHSIDYSQYDVIINTSSEHIEDIRKWRSELPSGKIVIVQNNDYDRGEGHISCVSSSNELGRLLNLSEVLYQGEREFPQYKRFMVIGIT